MNFKMIAVARGGFDLQPEGIDYLPDVNLIVIWQGFRGPAQVGAQLSFQDALERFSHEFVRLEARWFLPILERLAQGHLVTVEEILQLGKSATGHQPEVLFGPL